MVRFLKPEMEFVYSLSINENKVTKIKKLRFFWVNKWHHPMTKWAKNTQINDWSVITRTVSIRPFFRERTEETIISSRFVWIVNCSFKYGLVRYGLYCAEVNEYQICKWTFASYCWYIVTFVFFCVDTKKTNKRHLWIWSCRGWGQGVWFG